MRVMVFILILLSMSKSLFAEASPVILKDGKEFYEIGLNLDILEDPTGKLTIDDVNSLEWAGKFKKSEKKVPNFGISKSAFWARVKIQNKTNGKRIWFISHNYVLQDHVTLFKKLEGRWKPIVTGDKTAFKTREIEDKSFSFIIKPMANSLYFLRITGAVNRFNLSLSSPKALIQKRTGENLISGLFLVLSWPWFSIIFLFFFPPKA